MNPLAAAGRTAIRALDLILLRRYGIFSFSDDPACVLRLSRGTSRRTMVLGDGTHVARGEPILEIHFWNEQLPPIPAEGETVAWGLTFARRIWRSLRQLAEFLAREPQFQSVRVLHAETGVLQVGELAQMRQFVVPLGFEFRAGPAPGWRFWKGAFWANLYSWWLMWAFNPASLRGKHFSRTARCEIWLSRTTLMEKYGGAHSLVDEPSLKHTSAQKANLEE